MTELPEYFRPISAEGIEPVKPDGPVGPPIQMKWIPIEKLFVDTRYQRDIAKGLKSNVRQIGAHFLWRRFAPIIVTPIEGTDCFSIIDGQHKTTGAFLRGLKQVPCAVVEAPTLEEQGDSFKFLNANVTRIAIYDIFKANLASRDADALNVARIAKKAGVKLVSSATLDTKLKQGECRTYKSFTSHMRQYKEDIFVKACQTLVANPTSKGLINSATLGALCNIFKGNPRWLNNESVDKILSSLNILILFNRSHAAFRTEGATHKTVLTRMVYDKIKESLKEDGL